MYDRDVKKTQERVLHAYANLDRVNTIDRELYSGVDEINLYFWADQVHTFQKISCLKSILF